MLNLLYNTDRAINTLWSGFLTVIDKQIFFSFLSVLYA